MEDTTDQTPNPWGIATNYNATPPNSTFILESPMSPLLDKAMRIVLIICLVFSMTALGCTMEISKIKAHLLKPKGVAIAVVSQYGFMPLAAYLLARLFQLDSLESLTVLICGCCPGGALSNYVALAIQGDMNLRLPITLVSFYLEVLVEEMSGGMEDRFEMHPTTAHIVMTTCSVLLALGMMPLLLYLYSMGIPNIERMVPYTAILLSLVMTVVPCSIGIAINHRVPQYSPIIIKVGMSILLISFTTIAILGGVAVGDTLLRVLSPRLLVTASLMPIGGFLFGYLMSSIFRLNGKCRRTIGVETGFQNVQICFTILKVAFPLEVIGRLLLFPFVFAAFQVSEFLVLAVAFHCYKRFKAPAKDTYSMPPQI